MITLAFDTSAKVASVAVLDGERTLATYQIDNGLTQSELILPMAENILSSLKLTLDGVGLLATSVGPGSFTGVRIGVSLVKGLAFGRDIPCVAVSTVEALAENLRGLSGIVIPVMDARRNQVYCATFKANSHGLIRLTEDRAISLNDLAEELKEYESESIYLVGDGYSVAKAKLKELGISLCETPVELRNENAASVGRVGVRKYEAGEAVKDTEISPVYLRLPQAERERLERINKG
jgi:tRNA threonylcarbamoyladenosine biosynthesis protein TsaB